MIGVAKDFSVPITSNGDNDQQLWTMSESKVFINAIKSVLPEPIMFLTAEGLTIILDRSLLKEPLRD